MLIWVKLKNAQSLNYNSLNTTICIKLTYNKLVPIVKQLVEHKQRLYDDQSTLKFCFKING